MNSLLTTYRYPTTLFRDFSSIFDDLSSNTHVFSPTMTYEESPTEYIITGELPGMVAEDIVVELKDKILSISGEKPAHTASADHKIHSNERKYGKFQRYFSFSHEIHSKKVNAEMKNGLLTVRIPKVAPTDKGTHRLTVKQA